MPLGYVALVLHAHLPYVRHPEEEYSLAEKWYHEAVTETYVPLIRVLQRLLEDRVPVRLTVSLSPPLASMMADDFIQRRYLAYLERLRELAAREVWRTRNDARFHVVARMYQRLFEDTYRTYTFYKGNLVAAWRELQEAGAVEMITCAATHGYLPLIGLQREVVRAQVQTAVQNHIRLFGQPPEGLWLPECGYNPGDDAILRRYNLKYFFVDAHGLLYATPRPRYSIFAPVMTPSGVAAFGRDLESSEQVWSAQEGYPGDFDYREFYRDIGYDLDFEYIRPYIHPSGLRVDTGLKYYRITGKTNLKEPYVPEWASRKAQIHAGNFLFNREHQIRYLAAHMDRPPLIVCPYDAELFGHWWFEGPQWLESLFRQVAGLSHRPFGFLTPSDYLERFPKNQPATPCMSSWGNHGYNEVWLDGSNDWIYRHLHNAAEAMITLANRYVRPSPLEERALNQAARELLLAQSSDWAFIMKTGTMVEYAVERTKKHLLHFWELKAGMERKEINEERLREIEERDNIFPDLNYRVFASEA
ncbi:glycoside hydrolase family 57 protein [Thermanaeromonas sp. C210]|uniref:glycoside hydrolase family 57 protein n=1 Tax=Thermanaeromonas sp. C210 TaxID=2731925 RepID=UPI00155D1320|nr:1,4-alpha-glucan branching protein domain-containing protein [Thermanaeromonas sp. C210]GFN22405.1 glycoside hydrolase family protein [Thermanaeromonas sp. C210]